MAKTAKAPATAVAVPAKSVPARLADHMKAFDTLVERAPHAREVVSDRVKLYLHKLGDYVIGWLEGIRESENDNGSFRIYDFQFPGDHAAFMLGTGNLDQKLSGNLVGHVVGVMYVDDQDLGRKGQSPMRVFRVIDFGDTYPAGITEANCVAITPKESANGAASDQHDDLPF